MKVKDLIEELKEYDGEREVQIAECEGCNGAQDYWHISDVDCFTNMDEPDNLYPLYIEFDKGCMCCRGSNVMKKLLYGDKDE